MNISLGMLNSAYYYIYIRNAVVEALRLSSDDFPVTKSSIQRIRIETRKSRAEASDFQNDVTDVVTIHWDGKLLPGLDVQSSKEECMLVIASFHGREQLLAVPKPESSSAKHQAEAISTALFDWNLLDNVQIMYCDITASNTGRFNGACAILEKTLGRELLPFACCHHIYELVLKAVFETKIKQIASSPDIPMFKRFREIWKNIDSSNIEPSLAFVTLRVAKRDIQALLIFYKIKTKIPWNPYFNPKLPLNPTVGPSELYTNVEEVKVDWKNIERLFPQQTVPIPPVKETYPSGWVPPKGSSLDCPYHVKRSRNHMLPVYFVNRTVKTQRGGWSYTQILHIEGDIW
ncbi:hypothetical protein QYM36_014668, partial [Artemia franciscana]